MTEGIIIALMVAASGVITATISAYALIQSQRTHQLINSRMDQLLKEARLVARAAGMAEGLIAGQEKRESDVPTE